MNAKYYIGKMEQEEIEHQYKNSLLLALGWVNEHLAEFAIQVKDSESFNKQDLASIKPASELALTLFLLKRCGIKLPVLEVILDWLWKQYGSGLILNRILLARNDFLPSCALYSSFYQLGYRSDILDSTLAMLSQTEMAKALPLQPWAMYALNYNLQKMGLRSNEKLDDSSLYIRNMPEPWIISNEIGYAITHEIFYMTDFGFAHITDQALQDYLQIWIPYWSDIFFKDGDFDLTAEFSMTWSCINQVNSSNLCNNPLIPILSSQEKTGSVKGPQGAGSFLYAKSDSSERRIFLSDYHTTLVFIMANAMALKGMASIREGEKKALTT
jgi:hypothetical protein